MNLNIESDVLHLKMDGRLDIYLSILSNTQTVNEETTFTKSAATLIPGAMGPD